MPRSVALVISDIDGTLLTSAKELTPASVEAVQALYARGISFAVTSSRPPLGMRMLEAPLGLKTPLAGFNGGQFLKPGHHETLLALPMAEAQVPQVLAVLDRLELDAWLFTETRWFVRDVHAFRVERESRNVGLKPTAVGSFVGLEHEVLKITGVSEDHAAVAAAEEALAQAPVSARRSQPYYLDVTDRRASKGQVVARLSEWLSVPTDRIAVVGDAVNDIPMFEAAGLSIAMGNAAPEVKACAAEVTLGNDEDGFARAIHRFVLEDE